MSTKRDPKQNPRPGDLLIIPANGKTVEISVLVSGFVSRFPFERFYVECDVAPAVMVAGKLVDRLTLALEDWRGQAVAWHVRRVDRAPDVDYSKDAERMTLLSLVFSPHGANMSVRPMIDGAILFSFGGKFPGSIPDIYGKDLRDACDKAATVLKSRGTN